MPSLVDIAKAAGQDFQDIPIIDLTNAASHDPLIRASLAEEIRNACINVGFFYVKNHGVPEETIQGALEMAKAFFALPLETKMKIENRKNASYKGYSPLLSGNNNPDNVGDLQEGFELGWEDLEGADGIKERPPGSVLSDENVWPSDVPDFRQTILKYYHSVLNLGKTMFPLFALALNLEESFFNDKTRHSAALMKLLHYPPQSGIVDEKVIGIGAHTDWECFTILWQEPGIQALQVLNSQKRWIDAPPIPGTFVINLGDQFARWTNDVFKSTVHRAINRSGAERYSIPLFFGTDYDVRLEAIPSCISTERPQKYEVVTAGEYVKARFQATYAKKESSWVNLK